jgi:HEAT repeat protein
MAGAIGMPVGTALANSRSAALMAMLAELARARCVAALDEVVSLLEHPDFNVRWAAAKCLGKLDAGVTHQALVKLAGDPHPTIASMARSALAALGATVPDDKRAELEAR